MGQTQGQKDAGKIAAQQAQEETALYNLAEPGIMTAMSGFSSDLGAPGSIPASISTAFNQYRDETNKAYAGSETSAPITAAQVAKQGGNRVDPGAVGSSSDEIIFNLESQRRAGLRQISEQETDAAMAQQEFDLGQILGTGEGDISTGFGFGTNAINAARLNTNNPTGGLWSGAASGAAAGAPYAGATYGLSVLAGALIGGAAGYYSSGG